MSGTKANPSVSLGTEFDIDNLLRMDSVTQMEVLEKASGVMTIDEKRGKIGLKPVEGGASVYLQQQNFSLEALAKRDAQDNPFAKGESAATSQVGASEDKMLTEIAPAYLCYHLQMIESDVFASHREAA